MMMFRFVLVGLLFALSAHAEEQPSFVAGKHYEVVKPAVPTKVAEGKIEVVELFWYGCPHCFKFEPAIDAWLKEKADYIEFVRVPAVFAKNWEVHARAYYVAEQLGVLDKTHGALFHALHILKRKIFSEDELAAFFAEHGVTESAFREAFNSFDVDSKSRAAISLTRKYGITGVPAVIVNGKYRSSARRTDTYEKLMELVDTLAAAEAGVE
jgi:protein dithiol oxidoreductase (disulfide-forming)